MTTNYLNNANLKAADVPLQFTQEQLNEYVRCSEDPVYFIEKYVKIINVDRGLVDFALYPFQQKLVNTLHNNRFVIAKCGRQQGKTITIVSYILHYVLFNPNMTVAILANKQSTAKEILSRFKFAYENLPIWLQQGVISWNKGSVELENGSKIIASATSTSAIRGISANIVVLDEFAFVPQNIAEDFFESVYPTISSGTTTKIFIISTPKGMNMFYRLWTDARYNRNGYVTFEANWKDVPGRDETWKQNTLKNCGGKQTFDQEYNCYFLGSTNTLIEGEKLRNLTFKPPLWKNNEGLAIFENPREKHMYAMVCDVSSGSGLDYHAFTIIDITQMPYKVVCRFKNNEMPTLLFPNLIHKMATQYNEAYVLIEINGMGNQVATILYNELEYANLLQVSFRGRGGQTLDGGFGNVKTLLGVTTSVPIKRLGCSVLKTMVEDDKIILEDYEIIKEIVSFVAKKGSYEAEPGMNDDLIMTLVLFCWMSTQPYFKDMTDVDIRKRLYDEKMKAIDEEVLPFGFVDDGLAPPTIDMGDKNFWNSVEKF